jgi:predicted ester cyclase
MMVSGSSVTRRFCEVVWNERDLASVPDLVTEDFTIHVSGASFTGRDKLAVILTTQWFDPFPDISVRVEQVLEEGDLVADRLVFSGTHTGSAFLPGLFRARGLPAIPATGAEFEFTQTNIYRLVDSRIAELWEDFDRIRLFLQLGVGLVVPEAD